MPAIKPIPNVEDHPTVVQFTIDRDCIQAFAEDYIGRPLTNNEFAFFPSGLAKSDHTESWEQAIEHTLNLARNYYRMISAFAKNHSF